jgi:hypothetical protein
VDYGVINHLSGLLLREGFRGSGITSKVCIMDFIIPLFESGFLQCGFLQIFS